MVNMRKESWLGRTTTIITIEIRIATPLHLNIAKKNQPSRALKRRSPENQILIIAAWTKREINN